MDPDEVLRLAREAMKDIYKSESESEDIDVNATWALVDAFSALDHWMSHGGFLPRAWARLRKRK